MPFTDHAKYVFTTNLSVVYLRPLNLFNIDLVNNVAYIHTFNFKLKILLHLTQKRIWNAAVMTLIKIKIHEIIDSRPKLRLEVKPTILHFYCIQQKKTVWITDVDKSFKVVSYPIISSKLNIAPSTDGILTLALITEKNLLWSVL